MPASCLTSFLQIWRYFHLADNAVAIHRGADGFEKIYRVRNYLNIILRNIQDEYRLAKNIAIDETMVPHKGKLAFKQDIKSKPTKWGIKLWVLSEATTVMFIGSKYALERNMDSNRKNT